MGAIRFKQNINLKVEFDGEKSMVPFNFGDVFNAVSIEVDAEGYNDIFMPDGSILRGISSEVFENMGNAVPTSRVDSVQAEPDNQEFEVEEPTEERVATLDGSMLGEDNSYADAKSYAAENE